MSTLHHHTPTLTVRDPRGLAVRTVAYHRRSVRERPQARITRQVYDARGFLRQQWDPRLFALQAGDPETAPNAKYCYSLAGQVLSTDSVDSGQRSHLLGSGGQVLANWDGQGAWQRQQYDGLLRPVAVFEQAGDEASERCVERLTYAGMSSEYAARNACGRLVRHDDPAGTLLHEHYDTRGHLTEQRRALRQDAQTRHWPEAVAERDAQLQSQAFITTWQYDAMGRVLEQTDAQGNRHLSRYGEDGVLTQSALVLNNGVRKILLHQRIFNALGQVTQERAGNGVISAAQYSPVDGRLQRLTTYREGQVDMPLQDLSYRYDRVGNLLQVSDGAQPTRWASNTQVNPTCTYAYDSLSQLINATGRENARHQDQTALPPNMLFGSTQDDLWRHYTREYEYDAGGNLSVMRHLPSTGTGFTQRMRVGVSSNHALQDSERLGPGLGVGFDHSGNLQALARGQVLSWNLRNQLVAVTQVQRANGEHDDERYVYDSAGQRILKRRVQRHGSRAHTHEVIYLPGLELHRNHVSGEWRNVVVARVGRATVRVLQWQRNRPAEQEDHALRFSVCDHLGSSTLELDENAALLTQEAFYPFGGTAWRAARNTVEARYRTVRYSGRERDATGLYYYGLRYYAPWLLRWVSADPGGEVDGLNLYAMVGNNPVNLIDVDGSQAHAALQAAALLAIFTLVGFGMGEALGFAEVGAGVGFIAAVVLFVVSGYQYVEQERRAQVGRAAVRRARQAQALGMAKTYAQWLTDDEVAGLAEFFSEQLASVQSAEFAFTIKTSVRGGIYASFGSADEMQRAQQVIDHQPNPGRFLRKLGYSSYTVREPPARRGSGPRPLGGVPETQTQPVTRATTVAHRRAPIAAEQPVAPAAGPSSTLVSVLDIDTDAIVNELQAQGGQIIRRVLDDLIQGIRKMASGHLYHAALKTRSFDLPGYRGQTGRGAYRLLVQHQGGRQYRATGILNPHRG